LFLNGFKRFLIFFDRDLFEELASYLKEACDRKQENVRRRKRKDNLRLQVLRILELIAKEGTFGKMGNNSHAQGHHHHLGSDGNAGSGGGGGVGAGILPVPLQEFLESCKGWLETETDRDGGLEMRLNFCKALHFMLDSFDLELKEGLLKRETKKQLFALCVSWAGPYYAQYLGKELNAGTSGGTGSYGASTNNLTNSPGGAGASGGISGGGGTGTGGLGGGGGGGHYYGGHSGGSNSSELEFAALQAAAGLLTCGPVFQQSLLFEESHLYSWLDFLISTQDHGHNAKAVNELGERVMIMLLEFNPDVGSVLDWIVGRCFTGAPQIADACFRAIATLFSAREYPCDRYVAIINSALLYSGSPKVGLQQTAFRLLQVLDRRFFGGLPSLQQVSHQQGGSEKEEYMSSTTLDGLLSRVNYAKSQTFLSKQLSFLHPELTMPIFSGN